jgi:hypothetical protein
VKWRKTWTIKERIKESRYNRKYETCMTEEIPEYLGKETSRERKTRREKAGIGRKERKEDKECAMRRE